MTFPTAVVGDNIDQLVCKSLERLHNDLLSSLHCSSTSLTAFLSALSKVDSIIRDYHQTLKADTLDLVYSFANSVAVLSSGMLDINSENDTLMSKFTTDMVDILDEKTRKIKISDEDDCHASYPCYIEPCYRWLKDNLHDPYPALNVRAVFARTTHSSRKDIDAWFIDARKRIGWNGIRRKHFQNKRADILDAAARFFIKPDAKRPLSSSVESEFAGVEARALSLYNEKFMESSLAAKLDVAVKDMTPRLKEQLREEKERKKSEKRKRNAHNTYPTPESSPVSSVAIISSPTSLTCEFTTLDVPTHLDRKRRSSMIAVDNEEISRRTKRIRTESYISSEAHPATIGLPSPASSTQGELGEATEHTVSADELQLPSATSLSQPTTSLNKRKRRLSDGYSYPPTKRPQLRLQAVSDPVPVTTTTLNSLEQWFSDILPANLTNPTHIPSPVSVEAPDPSTPLEIELFSFPAIPDFPSTGSPAPSNELASSNVLCASQVSLNTSVLDESFDWLNCDFIDLGAQNTQPASYGNAIDVQLPSSSTSSYIQPTALQSIMPGLNVIGSPSFLPSSTDSAFWTDSINFTSLGSDFSLSQPFKAQSRPSLSVLSTGLTLLTESEREAKRRELEELEARVVAIRAEINI